MTNRKVIFSPIPAEIDQLVKEHGSQPEKILEILREMQARSGTLTKKSLDDVAHALEIPASRVFGIATFYSMLEVAETKPSSGKKKIKICDGPACWLCGLDQEPIMDSIQRGYPDLVLERTSCLGLCDHSPAALVGATQISQISHNEAGNLEINVIDHAKNYITPRQGEVRVVLSKAGIIDPESIDSALEHGAYQGLLSAINQLPGEVITEVENSCLNGRGGAGFPTGRKWKFTASAPQQPKFVLCNADESEPLIFKDRVLIDTNPHQILEGMTIAGYAVGAREGYIYIRGEYEKQACLLERAISQAEQAHWLGDQIAGSDFSFHIHVHRGAGAYICGEETALIESLEGKRGEPRVRPPYPPTSGYHNLPTVINNVETFAAVPHILARGGKWFKELSNNPAGGTKVYMLLGHVKTPGLFEAPIGLTLREIIDHFGGGMQAGSTFQFALCGGAAGTLTGEKGLDQVIDYTSTSKGVSLGAGAFLVCDQRISPVAMLERIVYFFEMESCGKCTPCREGTARVHEILINLRNGQGQGGDIEDLHRQAEIMQTASFCGLGQSVSVPVISALTNFPGLFLQGMKGK